MNTTYQVDIEILTPLHIGDGKDISGLEYFCYQNQDGAYLYKFDINDLVNILTPTDKESFLNIIKQGEFHEITKFLYNLLEDVNGKESSYKQKILNGEIEAHKIPIKSKSFYQYRQKKIQGKGRQSKGKTQEARNNEQQNQQSQMNIKTFINSFGRYYIPGSSLKGALRTVLSNKTIENNRSYNQVDKDPFKKLLVQDSEFFPDNNIMIGALARMGKNKNNKQQGDGQYAEFVEVGATTKTTIAIKTFPDENSLEKIDFSKENICKQANAYLKEKIKRYIEQIDQLIDQINQTINEIDQKINQLIQNSESHEEVKKLQDKKMANEKKKQKFESVKQSYQAIQNIINECKENECILALGFGTGYWFKMIEDYQEKHPLYCSVHKEWNIVKDQNGRIMKDEDGKKTFHFDRNARKNSPCDNKGGGTPLKNFKSGEQIPRTNRTTDLQNLGFVKLIFN